MADVKMSLDCTGQCSFNERHPHWQHQWIRRPQAHQVYIFVWSDTSETFCRFTTSLKYCCWLETGSWLQYLFHAGIKERLSKSYPNALGSSNSNFRLAPHCPWLLCILTSGQEYHLKIIHLVNWGLFYFISFLLNNVYCLLTPTKINILHITGKHPRAV